MSDKTKIEWSDATWNPVTGCTKVSEGCRNCYALTFAERWRGTPGHYFENGFDITLRPEKLDQPLKWKRPRKIFVNSMSDLFHKEVPSDFIIRVWETMAAAPQHIFQILTKRPERMRDWVSRYGNVVGTNEPALENVWLGVSVENQKAADERIPLLLQTPAAVRFLSCEPLLGPVELWRWIDPIRSPSGWPTNPELHWVIAGGESGPGARPMHPEWARSLREQCQASGVPFFFKQWGEWMHVHETKRFGPAVIGKAVHQFEDGTFVHKLGKQKTGRQLDGRTWDEFPEEMA